MKYMKYNLILQKKLNMGCNIVLAVNEEISISVQSAPRRVQLHLLSQFFQGFKLF